MLLWILGYHNDFYLLQGAHLNIANDCSSCHAGDYNNTIAVFPNDPYRIIAGGVNLWHGKKRK